MTEGCEETLLRSSITDSAKDEFNIGHELAEHRLDLGHRSVSVHAEEYQVHTIED